MSNQPPSGDLGAFLERVPLPPGWQVHYDPVVESTMHVGREAVRRGWPDRSAFVCDYQTAGRGRAGRRWEAPRGLALLFTVLRRSSDSPLLETMLASVALCEAIEQLLQIAASIKWPNDLMLDNRKLAGVLAESCSGGVHSYTLVGCGVNVNQTPEHLAAVGQPATSLNIAAGREVHRGELLALCLDRFDSWLTLEAERRTAELREAWQSRLWRRGQVVRLRDQQIEFDAVLEGLAPDGSLLVRLESGELRRTVTAEILL